MPAPISIVIPTLGAAVDLPGTLSSLFEGLDAGVIRELVISDGGSEDDTVRIAEEAGARVVSGRPGRGGQLRRGVAAATGDWVLILHADTQLSPGWSAVARAHIAERPGEAGYFRLAFRSQGLAPHIVAGWANVRSRLFALPYGDQGLLLSRKLLDEVSGVPDIPLMEDVALARALQRRLCPLDAVAATSARRYEREGWLRRGARNLVMLTRYLLGADPSRLADDYRRRR